MNDYGIIQLPTLPAHKHVVRWGGRWVPVTNMYDFDGAETNNPAHAWSCVAYTGPDKWLALTVRPGEIETRQLR